MHPAPPPTLYLALPVQQYDELPELQAQLRLPELVLRSRRLRALVQWLEDSIDECIFHSASEGTGTGAALLGPAAAAVGHACVLESGHADGKCGREGEGVTNLRCAIRG